MDIAEVAQRSGVPASALRFYEERGLITAERSLGNQRRFPRAVLRRVAFIRVCKWPVGSTLTLMDRVAYRGAVPVFETVKVAAIQASPVILDSSATIEKALGLLHRAADDGVTEVTRRAPSPP
mgnify:CR=1 FL=1